MGSFPDAASADGRSRGVRGARGARRALPLVVATVLALVLGGLSPTMGVGAVTITAPSVKPAQPMANESTTFSGSLGVSGVRAVVLQYRTASGWRALKESTTTSQGRYAITIRPTRTRTYRVIARSVSRSTAARKVAVVGQSVKLTLPIVLVAGVGRSVTATARPIRQGRSVALQTWQGGSWVTKATAAENRNGVARFRYSAKGLGTAKWRAIAVPYHGAGIAASRALTRRTVPKFELISRDAAGSPLTQDSYAPMLSQSGRWVAFTSEADGLIPGDTGGDLDAFLHDRLTGATVPISAGNGDSLATGISADGRFVVFDSADATLVANDDNGEYDSFLWDRTTSAITLISRSAGDGTPGNGRSVGPRISANGRFVTFMSRATDLVPSDPPSLGSVHLYRYDRSTGTMLGIDKVGAAWGDANSLYPTINADGSVIGFVTNASNLGGSVATQALFSWSATGGLTNHTPDLGTSASRPAVSADGRYLAFDTTAALEGSDTDATLDVYLVDRVLDTVSLASSGTGPAEYGASFASAGPWLAYTTAVNVPGDDLSGDTDVVLVNVATGLLSLVTTGAFGYGPHPGSTGDTVGFSTDSGAYAADDSNGVEDVVLRAMP